MGLFGYIAAILLGGLLPPPFNHTSSHLIRNHARKRYSYEREHRNELKERDRRAAQAEKETFLRESRGRTPRETFLQVREVADISRLDKSVKYQFQAKDSPYGAAKLTYADRRDTLNSGGGSIWNVTDDVCLGLKYDSWSSELNGPIFRVAWVSQYGLPIKISQYVSMTKNIYVPVEDSEMRATPSLANNPHQRIIASVDAAKKMKMGLSITRSW